MKREIPVIITFTTCLILLVQFILDFEILNSMSNAINDYTSIVTTFAMVLGLASLASVHLNKIYRKRNDWQYSIILLLGFIITLWCAASYGLDKDYSEELSKAQYIELQSINEKEKDKFDLYTESEFYYARSNDKVKLSKGLYEELKSQNLPLEEKIIYKVRHKNKYFYTLIFENIYDPLQATMFSLLAFFMASAAFRAFRAKSFEASLLLISAFLVMLGRVPLGELLGGIIGYPTLFPDISDVIMKVFNTSGQRAIMIGAALGMVAASFRIWIGLEKEHLGRD